MRARNERITRLPGNIQYLQMNQRSAIKKNWTMAIGAVVTSIVLIGAAPRRSAPLDAAPDRVYSAVAFNRRPIPSDVWFSTSMGAHHWIRLDQAVLRLRADQTFRASARYYRQRRNNRTAPANRVVLSEMIDGIYSIRGDTIALYVRPGKKQQRATRVLGRIVNGELLLAYTVVDGTDRHNVSIRFRRDPTIW
jgi:hypothetical protein